MIKIVGWLAVSLIVNTSEAKVNQVAKHKSLIFGHRGFKGEFAENSLEGFAAAIAAGVDGIELDVVICKTGELLVFHDRLVDRLTNGTGYIADLTFAQVRKLHLANGEQIPTLAQCLQVINRQCIVDIELKGAGVANAVAQVITDFIVNRGWQPSDFIITSYDHPQLQKFHQLMPQLSCGPIIDCVPLRLAAFAQELGAKHLVANINAIPAELVADAHARGITVSVHTVNDLRDFEQVQKRGVDIVITDLPALMLNP